MPRHRTTQRATHHLTATREATGEVSCSVDADCPEGYSCEDGRCVDAFGTPYTGGADEPVVEDEPVRYDSGGTSYVRGDIGERVQRMPTATGRGALMALTEGDTVTLEPLASDGTTLDALEVRSIDPDYGRRVRVGEVSVELEQN